MGPKRARPQGRSKSKPLQNQETPSPASTPSTWLGGGDGDSLTPHNLGWKEEPKLMGEENGNLGGGVVDRENNVVEFGGGDGDGIGNVTYLPRQEADANSDSPSSPNTTSSSTPSGGTFKEWVEEEEEENGAEENVIAATLNLDPRGQRIEIINQSQSPVQEGRGGGGQGKSISSCSSPNSYTTAEHSPTRANEGERVQVEEKESSITSIKSAPPDLDLSYSQAARQPQRAEEEARARAEVEEPQVVRKDLAAETTAEAVAEEGGATADAPASSELALPNTVTVLELENAKVYLIGTAHFSTQSQEDVRTTIRLTQPHAVLLELCPSRRNILHLDEEMLLKEAGDISFAKVMQILKSAPPEASRVQSLLHLLLLSMSANLTKKLGMAPGGEFRAAVQEANSMYPMKNSRKPTIIFGDRPFNVTLARAIASLSFAQKLKLAWQFIWSSDDITKEEIEKCKERDLLEKMLMEMTGEFPSITEVFVTERDYFLAHTLYMSAKTIAEHSEHDGEGPIMMVGVVGMGHVPGICRYFGTTKDDEFRRVGSMPPSTPPSTAVLLLKTSVKLAFYGAALYGAYKVFNRFDVFKKVNFQGVKFGFVKVK